ncbi:MAG: hypothetical protein ACRC9N_11185 [Aeromonas sp.]
MNEINPFNGSTGRPFDNQAYWLSAQYIEARLNQDHDRVVVINTFIGVFQTDAPPDVVEGFAALYRYWNQ